MSPALQRTRASIGLALLAAGLHAQTPILTGQYNNARTAGNITEASLNVANVTSSQFGKVGTFATDGQVFAQPLYVPHLTIGGKTVNVLYVATMHNTVYAYDADRPGQAPLWQVTLDPSVLAGRTDQCPASWSTGPELGILSAPVIDPATNTLYAVGSTPVADGYAHRLYALDITTGQQKFGSPATIAAQVNGTGTESVGGVVPLNHSHYIQRPALLLANGNVYAGFGSCGPDPSPYHGWLLGYNAANVQQQVAVYNTTPNGDEGAVWQSGHGLVTDSTGSIYFMTGNGTFDAAPDFGDSFQKLGPTGKLLDWFTPPNVFTINSYDLDLGVSGPVLITSANLLVGGGKDGVIYVLNPANMGHQNPPLQSFTATTPCTSPVFNGCYQIHGLAYLDTVSNPLLFEWGAQDNLRSYRLVNGRFNTTPDSQNPQTSDSGGSLAVSSNGSTAGTAVLWALTFDTGILHAFNATNVASELWNSEQVPARDSLGGTIKFIVPLVANGKVFVPSQQNGIVVYGLLAPITVALSPTSKSLSVGQQQQFTPTVTGPNQSLNWTLSPAVGTLAFATTSSGPNTYTAPSVINTRTTVTLTATSVADATKSASAIITLTPVSIAVSPTTATLIGGQQQVVTATVSGSSNTAVKWSMSPAVGTLSATSGSSVTYTAPSSITSTQTVTVTATSSADATKTASIAIKLSAPGASPYSYVRGVTILHSNVPNADQTNFPFLFNTTDPSFRSTANGGHVTSASGYDIVFTADSAGTVKLDHQLRTYNPVTGQVTAWVRIPTLSHLNDTTLYMFYGNASVTTSQENAAGIWDSNFVGVWHLGRNAALSGLDSTINALNGTFGTNATPASGLFGTAPNFDGTWNAYVDMSASSSFDITGPFTLSAWFKQVAYTSTHEVLMSKCSGTACNYELAIDANSHDLEGVQNQTIVRSGVVPSLNQWHYAVEVSDGTHLYFYLDGKLAKTVTAGTGNTLPGTYFDIGREKADGENFDGIIEEAHLSKAVRDANWIAAEYNNQASRGYLLSGENGSSSAYAHHRAVVIAHANVPNADQANFPMLFNTTDPLFRSTGNGGHVTSTSGYDIIFTADAAGTTMLPHELETYNAATGQVTAWVRVPNLSHTTDTTIYMFYGNPAITTSLENRTGVWDSNFIGVWHLGKNNALSGVDSTANAINSTAIGSHATSAAGLFGSAARFDGTWSAYLDMGTSSALDISGPFTLSAWFNDVAYTGTYQVLMSKCSGSACNYELALDGKNHDLEGVQNGTIVRSGVVPSLNQWHHAVEVSDGTHLYFYLDGTLAATVNAGTGNILSGTHFDIGREQVSGENFNGSIDEARLSKINRDANWIKTEYNNQQNTATFYTLTAEQ